ncbi:hypothetical protein P692DRAFT_20246503, partial [Suillus brevipes Sb2]
MRRTSDTNANNLTQQGQGIAGAQGIRVPLQERPTHTAQEQNHVNGTGEPSYVIGCCGFNLHLLVVSQGCNARQVFWVGDTLDQYPFCLHSSRTFFGFHYQYYQQHGRVEASPSSYLCSLISCVYHVRIYNAMYPLITDLLFQNPVSWCVAECSRFNLYIGICRCRIFT